MPLESSPPRETIQSANTISRNTRIVVTVLQFMVGGLVTLGGGAFTAFALNDFGKALGTIHLSLGLIGLGAGFIVLFRAQNFPRTFILAINTITIAYSTFSESMVEIQSLLPSSAARDSLIGTLIAIVMSATIIYLLRRKPYNHVK
jgi:hypothetical protein